MTERIVIHALIIADEDGRFLVDVIMNKQIDIARLSGFIAAFKMFGEETLGHIEDIAINGLNIDMLVVSKYNLIMIAIMDANIPETNFREGCERALDAFFNDFGDKIEDWNGSLKTFRDFREVLNVQIDHYLEQLKRFESNYKGADLQFEKMRSEMQQYNKKFFRKRGDKMKNQQMDDFEEF